MSDAPGRIDPPTVYRARYRDACGSEETTIQNDGAELRTVIRGVPFDGATFDLLAAPDDLQPEPYGFTLSQGDLCSCEIECEIPIRALRAGEGLEALLRVRVELGDPSQPREELDASLELGAEAWTTLKAKSFEDAFEKILAQLPPELSLRTCFTCAYSDYSPGGNMLFGDLSCFRGVKADYLGVKDKFDLFPLLRRASGQVQETHLCPEFAQRLPGTGYRG